MYIVCLLTELNFEEALTLGSMAYQTHVSPYPNHLFTCHEPVHWDHDHWEQWCLGDMHMAVLILCFLQDLDLTVHRRNFLVSGMWKSIKLWALVSSEAFFVLFQRGVHGILRPNTSRCWKFGFSRSPVLPLACFFSPGRRSWFFEALLSLQTKRKVYITY